MATSSKNLMADVAQDDMHSIAHLLRTFLPDHEELSTTENTEQLLLKVESTLTQPSTISQPNDYGVVGNTQVYGIPMSTDPLPKEARAGDRDRKDSSTPPKKDTHFPDSLREGDESDPEWVPDKEDKMEDSDSDTTIDIPVDEINAACSGKVSGLEDNDNLSSSSNKRYLCFICDETLEQLEPYCQHMSAHCRDPLGVKCQDCGETFPRRTTYNIHRRLSMYEIWGDMNTVTPTESFATDMDGNTNVDDQEKYVCYLCEIPSYRYKSFLKHVVTHKNPPYIFKCNACSEEFNSPCEMRSHIDSKHTLLMPFQCNRCLRRFKLKGSLGTHMKYCEVNPDTIPYAKEMQFIDQLSQERKFKGSQMDDDGLSQYSCPICTVMFDSPQDLKTHLHYHDETKPFKCEQCGRGFTSKRTLQKHAALHQSPNECWCQICGVQLLTKSGYNAHLRGHRNQELLQVQTAEKLGSDPSVVSTAESASNLLKNFKVKYKRRVSAKIEQKSEDESVSTITRVPGKKVKSYACPICGCLFFSGGEKFQAHARREHKDAEFERCPMCKKNFMGKDNLERHIRLHQMYTATFACEDCGKVFRRKYALQVHKRLHTFKKFVSCDICGQEFRFVSEVDKHKHTKHRYDKMLNIYKCNICGQRFPMLSHLSVHCHCHNMPESKPFECDLCKISFKTSIELKQHIFQKHDKLMNTLGEAMYNPTTGTFLSYSEAAGSGMDAVVVKKECFDFEEDRDDMDSADMHNSSTYPNDSEVSRAQLVDGPVGKANVSDSVVSAKKDGDNAEASPPHDDSPNNVDAYNWATRQSMLQAKFLKRHVCEVCDKAFASNSDLKTHRRTHSGETPFKCDFCERSFKQRGHRKLHIQVTHTKEMPYKCELCDMAFPTRYRYQVHVKRHSGVREHNCNHCDKAYYTFGKLNEHKKKRHKKEWEEEQIQKV